MAELNKAQQQAVFEVKNPLLIVAGAGTGKTSVITEKIGYLVREKLARPEEILALTFTDKAAHEMLERVDVLLDIGYTDMRISTFHAFCQELLHEFGLDIGIPNQFRVLTETDAWVLVREHFDAFTLKYYRPLGNPTKHIHEFIRHFSLCKDELITPEAYLAYAEGELLDTDKSKDEERNRLIEVAQAYHTYNKVLLDAGALDFSDLVYYAVQLLQKREGVRAKLQTRFKYILVDEFQDVNHGQYELVKLLTGSHTQLTVVGDDDQSIYAFRGASVSNILRFTDDFPEATKVVLTENYRSGQEILDVAYKTIQENNPDRLEIKLGLNKKLIAKGSGTKADVTHIHKDRLEDEVRAVTEEIIRLKESGQYGWDDVAVLVRANSHADPFLEAFERQGIPYEFLASRGLYRQPIILDCLNFFKVVIQHYDQVAMFRLLRLPCLTLSENDFQKIIAHEDRKKITFYESMKRATEFGVSPEGGASLTLLISAIHAGMKAARQGKPVEILYRFLEDVGYLAYLTREEAHGNAEVIQQIYQLGKFFEELETWQTSNPDAHIAHFLERYTYIIEAGDEGEAAKTVETPESVSVLTVHASKGLEWKVVFVVNLVEERFPTRRRGDPLPIPEKLIAETPPSGDEHVEEERRLFYVAVTRAKEKVYLTSAASYGGVREKKVSRFVVEAGLSEKPEAKKKETKRKEEAVRFVLPSVVSEKKSPTILHAPNSFSFSQIESYATCPYKYKLHHVLKIPTPSKGSFSFGSTMHLTFQKFYERVQEMNSATQVSLFDLSLKTDIASKGQIKVPTRDELLAIYEAVFITDWYASARQRDEYYAKGKEMLKVFYAANEDRFTVPKVLEGAFTIMVGKHKLRGRIDRVDALPDGTLEIIDYKTGKSKEKLVGDEKDQLLIYQIAATTLPQYRHLGKVGKLTFYYVNDNVQTSFVGSDEELLRLQEKLIGVIDNIHAGAFTATPSPAVCAWCDYRDICEYRTL